MNSVALDDNSAVLTVCSCLVTAPRPLLIIVVMLPTNVSIAFAVPAHSLLDGDVVVSAITSGPSDSGPTVTVVGNVSAQIPFSYTKYRSIVVLFCSAFTVTPSVNLEPLTPSSTCVLLTILLTYVPCGIVV